MKERVRIIVVMVVCCYGVRRTCVGRATVLAVELALGDFAMGSDEVSVAIAGDVAESLLAVPMAAAAMGAVGAERVSAAGSAEPRAARAFSVGAGAIGAQASVALEWGGTGTTAAATVASHPRRLVWVLALRRSRHQEDEDRCEHYRVHSACLRVCLRVAPLKFAHDIFSDLGLWRR